MKLAVITISDRASRGEYEDLSGPAITALLHEAFPQSEIQSTVVPDKAKAILAAYQCHKNADYILTSGGTGISPTDITPETTEGWCDRPLPGVAELLRAKSYAETPNAVFSRAYAGVKGTTIIINLPGSVKAARFCTQLLIPVLQHGLRMLHGGDHG